MMNVGLPAILVRERRNAPGDGEEGNRHTRTTKYVYNTLFNVTYSNPICDLDLIFVRVHPSNYAKEA